jgi:hypothetical protein
LKVFGQSISLFFAHPTAIKMVKKWWARFRIWSSFRIYDQNYSVISGYSARTKSLRDPKIFFGQEKHKRDFFLALYEILLNIPKDAEINSLQNGVLESAFL